jgi:hypothetical protein
MRHATCVAVGVAVATGAITVGVAVHDGVAGSVCVTVVLAAGAVVVIKAARRVAMGVSALGAVVVVVLVAERQQKQQVEGDTDDGNDEHELAMDRSWVDKSLHRFKDKTASEHAHDEHGNEGTDCFCAVVAEGVAHTGALRDEVRAVGRDEEGENIREHVSRVSHDGDTAQPSHGTLRVTTFATTHHLLDLYI